MLDRLRPGETEVRLAHDQIQMLDCIREREARIKSWQDMNAEDTAQLLGWIAEGLKYKSHAAMLAKHEGLRLGESKAFVYKIPPMAMAVDGKPLLEAGALPLLDHHKHLIAVQEEAALGAKVAGIDLWDALAASFGYESMADARAKGASIIIDKAAGVARLMKAPPK